MVSVSASSAVAALLARTPLIGQRDAACLRSASSNQQPDWLGTPARPKHASAKYRRFAVCTIGFEDGNGSRDVRRSSKRQQDQVHDAKQVPLRLTAKIELEEGQVLYVGGSPHSLGSWQLGQAVRMTEYGGHIYAADVVVPAGEPITYRYLIANGPIQNGRGAIWHHSGNRSLEIPVDKYAFYKHDELESVMPNRYTISNARSPRRQSWRTDTGNGESAAGQSSAGRRQSTVDLDDDNDLEGSPAVGTPLPTVDIPGLFDETDIGAQLSTASLGEAAESVGSGTLPQQQSLSFLVNGSDEVSGEAVAVSASDDGKGPDGNGTTVAKEGEEQDDDDFEYERQPLPVLDFDWTETDEEQEVEDASESSPRLIPRKHGPTVVRVRPVIRSKDSMQERRHEAARVCEPMDPTDEKTIEIIINASSTVWTRVAFIEDGVPVELFQEAAEGQLCVGDIYLGEVVQVLPAMKAVFVNIGGSRNALLDSGLESPFVGPVPPQKDTTQGNTADSDVQPAVGVEAGLRVPEEEWSWEQFAVGQPVVVQVKKEPIGYKGARVTAGPSLAGRFLVLFPGLSSIGISRQVAGAERTRLRTLVEGMRPDGYGIVVRTEAVGCTQTELLKDLEGLLETWKEVVERAAEVTPPALLHKAMSLTGSIVRDFFNDKVSRLVVDSRHEYMQITHYLTQTAQHMMDRVELYKETKPIFDAFNIERKLESIESSRVDLPGGGYLVIQQTEALVAVDVNGGRDVIKKTDGSMEDAVLAVNLEAAKQIALEMRLRDIGGIIVIDFIKMISMDDRKKVEDEFRRATARDRSRPRFTAISEFGLMEITRHRVRPSITSSNSHVCHTCGGSGRLPSFDSILARLERAIRRWQADPEYPERRKEQGVPSSQWPRLMVRFGKALAEYVKEDNKRRLKSICFACRVTFSLEVDNGLPIDDCQLYEIQWRGKSKHQVLIDEWKGHRTD
eukprot:jgi/Chlat1/2101/Chrsp17S02702